MAREARPGSGIQCILGLEGPPRVSWTLGPSTSLITEEPEDAEPVTSLRSFQVSAEPLKVIVVPAAGDAGPRDGAVLSQNNSLKLPLGRERVGGIQAQRLAGGSRLAARPRTPAASTSAGPTHHGGAGPRRPTRKGSPASTLWPRLRRCSPQLRPRRSPGAGGLRWAPRPRLSCTSYPAEGGLVTGPFRPATKRASGSPPAGGGG